MKPSVRIFLVDEQTKYEIFSSFCMTKERSFAHFIFIKWVGGVCVKQIDTVLLSSHSFLLHFTINQVLWGTLQQNL